MRFLLSLFLALSFSVAAQEWPSKPVRVIVGYPPGGGHDFTARVIAQRLNEVLKQPFVVENRAGASGTIATEGIARGPADGYSFIVASPAETVVGAVAGLKMNYDWEKDLAPVTIIGDTPLAIVVHPSVPAKNIQELLAYAKKNPGKLSYGTPGSGSSMHFAGESLKQIGGLFIVHIPYRGAAPAVSDLLGGQVPMGIVGMPPVVNPHKAGKLRIVAVSEAVLNALLQEPADLPHRFQSQVSADNIATQWQRQPGTVLPPHTQVDDEMQALILECELPLVNDQPAIVLARRHGTENLVKRKDFVLKTSRQQQPQRQVGGSQRPGHRDPRRL